MSQDDAKGGNPLNGVLQVLRPQGQTPQGDNRQLDPVLQLGKIVAAADGYNLKKGYELQPIC